MSHDATLRTERGRCGRGLRRCPISCLARQAFDGGEMSSWLRGAAPAEPQNGYRLAGGHLVDNIKYVHVLYMYCTLIIPHSTKYSLRHTQTDTCIFVQYAAFRAPDPQPHKEGMFGICAPPQCSLHARCSGCTVQRAEVQLGPGDLGRSAYTRSILMPFTRREHSETIQPDRSRSAPLAPSVPCSLSRIQMASCPRASKPYLRSTELPRIRAPPLEDPFRTCSRLLSPSHPPSIPPLPHPFFFPHTHAQRLAE